LLLCKVFVLFKLSIDVVGERFELDLELVPKLLLQVVLTDAVLQLREGHLVGFFGDALVEATDHLLYLRVFHREGSLLDLAIVDQWLNPGYMLVKIMMRRVIFESVIQTRDVSFCH